MSYSQNNEIFNYYCSLRENNELTLVFPQATGEWELDKKTFTKYYNENVKILDDFESNVGDLDVDLGGDDISVY